MQMSEMKKCLNYLKIYLIKRYFFQFDFYLDNFIVHFLYKICCNQLYLQNNHFNLYYGLNFIIIFQDKLFLRYFIQKSLDFSYFWIIFSIIQNDHYFNQKSIFKFIINIKYLFHFILKLFLPSYHKFNIHLFNLIYCFINYFL